MTASTQTLLSEDRPKIHGAAIGNMLKLNQLMFYLAVLLVFAIYIYNYDYSLSARNFQFLIYGLFGICIAIFRQYIHKQFSNAVYIHREISWFTVASFGVIIYFLYSHSIWNQNINPLIILVLVLGVVSACYACRHKTLAFYDDGIATEINFVPWQNISECKWVLKDNNHYLTIKFQNQLLFPVQYTFTEQEKQLIQPFLKKHLEEITKK